MLWNQVDAAAARCCRCLWDAGFAAYPVGGCVRDLLLGRVPGDWDVTTSALPEQVMGLFEHVVATGVKHGTVTVILGGKAIEVTTFRGESGYSDGRHPDRVCFDASLEQDLARRDFTINAMALAPDGGVVDLFDGQGDLKRRTIRCVGDPVCRFQEDGLRMFRAVRFGAQLGFELDGDTERAIAACAAGAEKIAAERVRVELEKTICSERPECAQRFFTLSLMKRWAKGTTVELEGLAQLPAQPLLRWAGLCAKLMMDGCVGSVELFLRELKLDAATLRACEAGWQMWRAGVPKTDADWRRALARYGTQGCCAGAAMQGMDALRQLEAVQAQEPCVRIEQLALTGGDLFGMGLRGTDIGAAQRFLLECVLAQPEENRADRLLSKVEEFLGRM